MTERKDICRYLDTALEHGMLTYSANHPLSSLCTFKTGGSAEYVVKPVTCESFCELVGFCTQNKIRYTVIGNGSNVLFDDRGYNGVIINTSKLVNIKREGTALKAECGVPISFLSTYAARDGLAGLTFAYGIPGTVGGAVFMNAGAFGGEIKDVVTEVEWFDTETLTRGKYVKDENGFGYRDSVYNREKKIILSAEFELSTGDTDGLKREMEKIMRKRIEKQPLEYGSAGSTFKRYPGYYTGRLIEEAGLKGYTVGGAQVSEKHAGFIINRGGASSKDVLELIDLVKKKIYEKNGIEIECEVRYIPYSE